jgi:hypothetical protein
VIPSIRLHLALCLLAALAVRPIGAKAQAGAQIAVGGLGTRSCASAVQPNDGWERWVLLYVIAGNPKMPDSTDPNDILADVRLECSANSSERLFDAVRKVNDELAGSEH